MQDMISHVSNSIDAVSRSYQTTTHNLANVSTPGYKRQLTQFTTALAQAMDLKNPAQGPTQLSSQTVIDFTQGAMDQTHRPLDLALDGDGFFVVETPAGPLFTRNGSFRINDQRQLVDSSGRLVRGEMGAIAIPPNAGAAGLSIGTDGTVSADGVRLGQISIVKFADKKGLLPAGGLCFSYSGDEKPEAASLCKVRQGYLEGSNVSAMQEMVSLITVSRLYEANFRTINAQDDKSKSLLSVAMG